MSNSAFDKIQNTGVLLSHILHLFLLFVAGISVLWAAVVEIMHVLVEGSASLKDILMLFIFIELGAMIGIYFKTNRLSVRFLACVAITALTRLLVIDIKSMNNATIVTITRAIVMLTASVFVLRAGTHWYGVEAGVRLFLLPVLLPAVAGWAFLWVRRVFQRGRGKPQEGIAVLAAIIPASRPRRNRLTALDFMHQDSYSPYTRTLGESSSCCDVSYT